ncbi:MAG: ComEC/Rec2 family competence protein [Alphaproteobacteria bacterium]|nr:ComEC/Rec2 family competence protein [Alphaproteobacteria bacterium]
MRAPFSIGDWLGKAGGSRFRTQTVFATPAARALAERDRWILWAPVALGLGVAGYFGLPREPWIGAGASLILVSALLWLGCRTRSEIAASAMIGLGLVGLGLQVAAWHAHGVAAPVLERELRAVGVEARILRIEQRPGRDRLILAPDRIDRLNPDRTPARIRLTAPDRAAQDLSVGQDVTLRATLRPPAGPAYPGGFDFRRWAWFQQIGATGFAIGPIEVQRRDGDHSIGLSIGLSLGLAVQTVRDRVAQRLRAALPGQTGEVAVALVVGDRSGLKPESLNAMRDSGLAHLLAISGLHIGLVAMTLFFSLRLAFLAWDRLALRFPIKKWAAAGALVGAFAYMILSGAPPPTQRAFVMTGLVLIAIMVDRRAVSMRLVALAAVIVLLWNPSTVTGASFQLSFAAVVALVAFYEAWSARRMGAAEREGGPPRTPGLVRYAAGVCATTLIASAATAPFVLHHFGRLALYGVVANLAAVPMMAFLVMPAGLLGLLLMPIGLEQGPLWLMGFGIDAVLVIAKTVAAWEGSHIIAPTTPLWALFLCIAGGVWLAIWRGGWRWWGAAGLALGCLAPLAIDDRPDILIADTGGAIAFLDRGTDRAFLIGAETDGYLAGRWARPLGLAEFAAVGDGEADTGAPIRCDALGCAGPLDGRLVALSNDSRSLKVDCSRAALVIAPATPIPRALCRESRSVGFFDLWRGGAHAVRFEPGGAIDIRAAHTEGRLWSNPDPAR